MDKPSKIIPNSQQISCKTQMFVSMAISSTISDQEISVTLDESKHEFYD
jgi:ribosomal protein L31